MKHRFKSIDAAARRVRLLEKRLEWYEQIARQLDNKLMLLARLAADSPQFDNPLEAMLAQKTRDEILSRQLSR